MPRRTARTLFDIPVERQQPWTLNGLATPRAPDLNRTDSTRSLDLTRVRHTLSQYDARRANRGVAVGTASLGRRLVGWSVGAGAPRSHLAPPTLGVDKGGCALSQKLYSDKCLERCSGARPRATVSVSRSSDVSLEHGSTQELTRSEPASVFCPPLHPSTLRVRQADPGALTPVGFQQIPTSPQPSSLFAAPAHPPSPAHEHDGAV